MPRTLQDDLEKDIKQWPADWDLHIIKTCSFIFDERENNTGIDCLQIVSSFQSEPITGKKKKNPSYELLRDNINLDSIDLRIILTYKDRAYICDFNKDNDTVIGNLLRLYEYDPNEFAMYVKPVIFIRGSSGYQCIHKMIEAIHGDQEDEIPSWTPESDADDIGSD